MKRIVIVALVCANVALVALLLANVVPAAAYGQTERGASNYLMVTGQTENGYSVIYVLDLSTRLLAAWKFDRTTNKLIQLRGRSLERDFAARAAVPAVRR